MLISLIRIDYFGNGHKSAGGSRRHAFNVADLCLMVNVKSYRITENCEENFLTVPEDTNGNNISRFRILTYEKYRNFEIVF